MQIRGPAKKLSGHTLPHTVVWNLENVSYYHSGVWVFIVRLQLTRPDGRSTWITMDGYEAVSLCNGLEEFRRFRESRLGLNEGDLSGS